MKKIKLILLSLILALAMNAQVYVKTDAQGANNGKSWQDAFTNLDSALLQKNQGQIWVAAGTYKPSVEINTAFKKYKAFNVTNGKSLYGGFKGFENNINQRDIHKNTTILSGDIGVPGNDLDNTPTVITIIGSNIDSTTIVDGFTITKSHYTNGYDYESGAVHIWCSGYPVIRNCTIRENFGFEGGGICTRNCTPLIKNNLISDNISYEGAGIYICSGYPQIIGNRIINNTCIGGYSHLSGGGIQIEAYSSPYIYGNLIGNNQAGHYGGGIANESNYSVYIANNIISENSSEKGGGIYIHNSATQIINNLIIANRAQDGGGIYIDYCSGSNSINNTIVNNCSDNKGSAVYLQDIKMNFINTIIFNNPTKTNKPISITNLNRGDWFPKFSYSDIENGKNSMDVSPSRLLDSLWKKGNITVYPAFSDSASYNFSLGTKSKCINGGIEDTTGLYIPRMDLKGTNRIFYNRIDIGCYELDSMAAGQFISATPRFFNLNGWADSTFTLNILSNTEWFITNTSPWVGLNINSGSNNANLTISAQANPGLTSSRTAKIFVSGPGVTSQNIPITVMQSPSDHLLLSDDTLLINSMGNDSPGFSIKSNLRWYISNYSPWITLNKYSGSNSDIVNLMVTENTGSGSRKGILTVYSYSGSTEIIRTLVIIQQPNIILSSFEPETNAVIKIYPNPVQDKLNISISGSDSHISAYIYSISGEIMYTSEFDKKLISIDMSNFEKGFYFLRLTASGRIKNYKIMKL